MTDENKGLIVNKYCLSSEHTAFLHNIIKILITKHLDTKIRLLGLDNCVSVTFGCNKCLTLKYVCMCKYI